MGRHTYRGHARNGCVQAAGRNAQRRGRRESGAGSRRESRALQPAAPPGDGQVPGTRRAETDPGNGRQNVLIVTTGLLGPVCREPGIGYAGLSAIAPKVAGSFEVRLTTGPFARRRDEP